MTKEEQGAHTLVATLSNHLSLIIKFSWVPFTLRIFLQIMGSSFENKYFLLTIMVTNYSQFKDLETVQVLDGKRILLSIPDSVSSFTSFKNVITCFRSE